MASGESVNVLNGITLRIEEGEFTAIMGTSGSGKTTLMNIIGCLDVPTGGSYALDGEEVSALSDDSLSVIRNEHVGFIFQNFYLIPYATVLENVMLPTVYLERHGGEILKKKAIELLKSVGLEERANFRPAQLSGGQQQRVAIARALVNEPKLILADEPTGQLDSNTSAEIMGILQRLNEAGRTIIIVTHDSGIANHTKRVIKLKDGLVDANSSL